MSVFARALDREGDKILAGGASPHQPDVVTFFNRDRLPCAITPKNAPSQYAESAILPARVRTDVQEKYVAEKQRNVMAHHNEKIKQTWIGASFGG